ncbi:hypothetical protein BDR03DRAFT_1015557 [Suillus americanus]|nr:hypothetical protein BDR03DRAFT_1015557 [Suillus americanus]
MAQVSSSSTLQGKDTTFKVVYPEVEYTPTTHGSVFGVTNQCLSEWHSNFGSTAIAIIIDFFSQNEDDVKELANYPLAKYAFLYEDAEVLDKATTIYRFPFMLQLVGTTHLQAIIGHADVPEFKTSTLAEKGIIGVISISAAALECALTLISNSDINVEDVLNKATGKEIWTIHTFSVSNWGSQTLAFLKLVQAKGDRAIKTIASMAWKVLKKSKSGLESFLNEDDSIENDPHAFLS